MTELAEVVHTLESKLQDHETSTANRLEILTDEIKTFNAHRAAAAAAPPPAASVASPSDSSDARLTQIESQIQAVQTKITDMVSAAGAALSLAPGDSNKALAPAPEAPSLEEVSALRDRLDGHEAALENIKVSIAAALHAAESTLAAASATSSPAPPPGGGQAIPSVASNGPTNGPPESLGSSSEQLAISQQQQQQSQQLALRISSLEDQSANFQRFIVEAMKRTSDLGSAVQEHEQAIAKLSALSLSRPSSSIGQSGAAGGTGHRPSLSYQPPSSARPSVTPGSPTGSGGGWVTAEQMTNFEFKITQTLTQMHQMHVAKVQEWEEQLAMIEGQIQQLSEDQQQLWLHASGSAPPPPVVIVNAPQAS